jgi:predicted DNA-binding transcriptional regulator AlpA
LHRLAERERLRYARRDLIRGVHIGKLWRFRGSTIEEWIEREELAS